MSNKSYELTLEKTFNLTSVFSEIRSSSDWNILEVKTMLLLFEEISKYAKYISSPEDIDAEFSIPTKYSLDINKWFDITGMNRRDNNFYRDFKKLRNSLAGKPVTIPHPLRLDCKKSSVSMPLFTKIEYLYDENIFSISVHDEHIKNLAYFVKYSKISFEYISKLKSHYSVFSYILFKLLLDSSKGQKDSLVISINEFKDKVGIGKKYQQINPFKEYVLDLVCNEINKSTQINLSYDLVKKGRAYKDILFKFSFKDKYGNNNIFNEIEEGKSDEQKLPLEIEAILISWGMNILSHILVDISKNHL